jgi:hypothetical protein
MIQTMKMSEYSDFERKLLLMRLEYHLADDRQLSSTQQQ